MTVKDLKQAPEADAVRVMAVAVESHVRLGIQPEAAAQIPNSRGLANGAIEEAALVTRSVVHSGGRITPCINKVRVRHRCPRLDGHVPASGNIVPRPPVRIRDRDHSDMS